MVTLAQGTWFATTVRKLRIDVFTRSSFMSRLEIIGDNVHSDALATVQGKNEEILLERRLFWSESPFLIHEMDPAQVLHHPISWLHLPRLIGERSSRAYVLPHDLEYVEVPLVRHFNHRYSVRWTRLASLAERLEVDPQQLLVRHSSKFAGRGPAAGIHVIVADLPQRIRSESDVRVLQQQHLAETELDHDKTWVSRRFALTTLLLHQISKQQLVHSASSALA